MRSLVGVAHETLGPDNTKVFADHMRRCHKMPIRMCIVRLRFTNRLEAWNEGIALFYLRWVGRYAWHPIGVAGAPRARGGSCGMPDLPE